MNISDVWAMAKRASQVRGGGTASDYFRGFWQLNAEEKAKGGKSTGELLEEVNESLDNEDWWIFSEVNDTEEMYPNIGWYNLPNNIRDDSAFDHNDRNSLLYNEGPKLDGSAHIYGTSPHDMLGVLDTKWGKYDELPLFFTRFFAHKGGRILFDPKETKSYFWVYKDEWENQAELSPNYTTDRKYKPKDRTVIYTH